MSSHASSVHAKRPGATDSTLGGGTIAQHGDGSGERQEEHPSPPTSELYLHAYPEHFYQAAAAIAAAAEIAYLYVLLGEARPSLRTTVVLVQAANAVLAGTVFWLSYNRWLTAYRRIFILCVCAVLIGNTMLATLITGDVEWLLLTLVTIVVGTSAMVPWTTQWQSALSAMAIAAFVASSRWIEIASVHWLEMAVAVAVGQVTTRFGMSYRSEIGAQLAELNAARRRAQASEKTMQTIFQAIPDPMVVRRMSDGTVVRSNRYISTYGFDQSTVERVPATLEQVWADPAERERFIATLREHGAVRNVAVTLRKTDGHIAPSLLSAVLVDIDGEECAVTIARDITELKEAERQLHDREEMFRKVFDRTSDAITISRLRDGTYVEVNRAFLNANSLRREDVIGHTDSKVGIWRTDAERVEFARRLVHQRAFRDREVTFRKPDGSTLTALVTAAPLDIAGEHCVAVFARDITEIKNTERELIAAREEALAASGAKTEFLSSMSHEIRTPMNSILGMADLLSETAMSAEQRHYVEAIVTNGGALLELINGILDLSRVESGRLTLEYANFDLREVVETVGATLAIAAHEKNLELTHRIAPGTPTALVGDAMRLRQVLINLAGNAIKFTEAGEISVEVAPDGDESGRLRFAVRDTGIGIDPRKVATLFQPFTQGDSSTTRKYGGSGLGLAIARRLVELMNGEVAVRSSFGAGSTFEFTAQFGLQAAGPSAQSCPPDLSGTSVLLVEDVATARSAVAEMLTECGAIVTETDCGERAIARAQQAAAENTLFSVAVVDSSLPGMSGYQTAVSLDRMGLARRTIVMMLCTDDLKNKIAKLRAQGIPLWVAKPVRRTDLFEALEAAMVARSEPGDGPSVAEIVGERAEEASRPAEPPAEPAIRILLADDSTDNRFLVRAYLRKSGYRLDEACDGREAIEMFRQNHYDLVLMDIQMPEVDGCQATRAIRQWEHDHAVERTPILALTASAMRDAAGRSIEAGCDAHITKPVKKAALLAHIREAIEAKQKVAAESKGIAVEE